VAEGIPQAMAPVETQRDGGQSGDRPMYGFQRG